MERGVRNVVLRSNIRRLLISSLLLVITVGFAILTVFPYFSRMLTQPHPLTTEEVLYIDTTSTLYFAKIQGDQMIDTTFSYTETNYGIQTSRKYYGALVLDNRLLLVESPGEIDESRTDYTGTLYAVPSQIQWQVIEALVRQEPDLQGVFLPVMLNTLDAEANWFWYAGTAVLVAISLACLYAIFTALKRFANPLSHPILQNLSRYGDLVKATDHMEEDRQGKVLKIGPLKAGDDWLLRHGWFAFDAMRFKDIVWAYPSVTTTRMYGVVPISRQHSLIVRDRFGVSMEVPVRKKQVEQLMQLISSRTPWAIYGYSDALKHSWDMERANFIAAVENRRDQETVQENTGE